MKKALGMSLCLIFFFLLQGCGKHSSPAQSQSASSVGGDSNENSGDNNGERRNCRRDLLISSILERLQELRGTRDSRLDSLLEKHLQSLRNSDLESLSEKGRSHRRDRDRRDRDDDDDDRREKDDASC